MPAVRTRPARPMGTPSKSPGQQGQPKEPRRHNQVKTLGRYVVDKKLGEGGMGTVYRATDSQLDRVVAIKVLPLEKAKDPRLVKRFRAEAQAAAQLRHKNIVGVYDSGEIDGFLYIAMEYIDGIDVHELVRRKGVLDVPRTRDIMRQLARALQHAHEQNIVHRDIKPANLMIDRDGKVRLADMGLARSLDDSDKSGITRAGTTVGTIDYMSPEQTRDSRSADTRSDMYSLGATWYHMLTGKPPFPQGDLLNRINAHASQPPPNPQDLNAEVPDGVVEVMHRMLAKKPEDRYQTPADLLDALDRMSLKKRTDLDLGLLSGLMEEDDDESTPSTGSSSRKKRPASKSRRKAKKPAVRPAERVQASPVSPESDDGEDEAYGLRPAVSDAPEPADDESDLDTAIDAQGGGSLNLDLLAALAEDDDDEPAARPRTPPAHAKPASTRAARRPAKPERDRAVEAKPKAAQKSKPSKKQQRRKPAPAREDTQFDADATDDAVPSRREVMLGRGSRHGRTGSAGSAMEDRKEIVKIAGIVTAVCVIGWFAFSAITGGSQPEQVPTDPSQVAPESDAPTGGSPTGDPSRGGSGTPSAPRRSS